MSVALILHSTADEQHGGKQAQYSIRKTNTALQINENFKSNINIKTIILLP